MTNIRRVWAAVAVTFLGLLVVLGSATTADARRPKPPPPPPPPTTVPVPPPPTSVPVPTSFTITSNVPDEFAVRISPSTQLGDAELLTGGPASVLVGDGGRVSFLRLKENTDVTFRYRNKIWNPSTNQFAFSPWVTFAFRTPSFDSLRPAAPTGLRVVERTATTVTVRWDPVPGAVGYAFSLNGGAPVSTSIVTCVYCNPIDPLTATFARPAPGTSVLLAVTSERAPVPATCTAYCFPDLRFVTSLPATLVVTS